MFGITDWIIPGWDGCNGGKFIDISRGNPSVDEGPGRWWRTWQYSKYTNAMSNTDTDRKHFFLTGMQMD